MSLLALAAAAADAAHVALQAAGMPEPVQMQSVGWNKTSIGVWTGIVVAIVYALLKFIAELKKLAYDRGDKLDDERRDDMVTMRKEIADIKQEAKSARERAGAAEDRAREAEARLSAAIIVIRMLSAKIEAEWPDDPILKNIHSLIDAATPQTELVVKGFSRIAVGRAKPD